MDKKCNICGRNSVDILCSKCGSFICERCYDPETDTCVKCSGKKQDKPNDENNVLLLVGGVMMAMMGLFITSFAFIPLTNARIIVFPFIFENVSTATAVLMSVMFFAMVSLSSLVPLYVTLQRNRSYSWDEGIYTLQENSIYGNNSSDYIEYMITTEIPENLKETIYIEDDYSEITLRSEKDPAFSKKYDLPDEFEVDTVESAYEDGFLVLKVKLVKS